MSKQKTIAIVGAAGAQGGGLARAILEDRERRFRARALTRDPQGDKARALRQLGAEIVAADLDDGASLERAFEGSYGAYCVTNFWEHLSPEHELAQAANMAEAAKRTGLEHVIWSTLEDTRDWVPLDDDRMPTLMGRYKVPHFDAKGEANETFTARGVPTTFLLASFYWENFINLGAGPARGADRKLALALPLGDAKLPGIAAADIGKCAFGIFAQGGEYVGRTVGIAGEHLTGAAMAAAFGRVLGEDVRYDAVPPEVYRGLGFPGAEDLGNMYQFMHDFNEYFCGARDTELSRRLNPALQDFDTWLAGNKARIPVTARPA
ncbi:MAG TPA: NmrA/HSCARG family protein [Woeseiaceae bacterium]|nr:NmrA/HSCARG family protein [Woeseiaceae bacterium]